MIKQKLIDGVREVSRAEIEAMAYPTLHICRPDTPGGERNQDITVEEWKAIISSDGTLHEIEQIIGRNPMSGETIYVPVPHSARWEGHPEGDLCHFFYRQGEVIVEHTIDEWTIEKAEDVAKGLSAEVYVEDWD